MALLLASQRIERPAELREVPKAPVDFTSHRETAWINYSCLFTVPGGNSRALRCSFLT